MAEDQERILCDEVVKLEEVVARLMDQDEENVKSVAHMADAVNKLGVRMTKVEETTAKLLLAALGMNTVVGQLLDKVESLEGKGANETRNEPDGPRVVRDDGPEYEEPGPITETDMF